MENIRNKYKVHLDEKKDNKKKTEKQSYDIASHPFGAEEMLLAKELKELDRDER